MKKYIIFLLLFSLVTVSVSAQSKKAKVTVEGTESDPKAKSLLEKARKKYEGLKSLQADFQLTIELAERKPEIQKGTMYQKGDKYRVKLPSQDVTSDGKAVYLFLKKNNEIQINDVDTGDANSLSPKALLKLYQQGNFRYYISGNAKENGKAVTQVEVVPNDRNVEYSKLRVSIDKVGQIVSLKSFNKDGSKYSLVMTSIKTNKDIKEDIFVFDKSKYPNAHIEDLRTN